MSATGTLDTVGCPENHIFTRKKNLKNEQINKYFYKSYLFFQNFLATFEQDRQLLSDIEAVDYTKI